MRKVEPWPLGIAIFIGVFVIVTVVFGIILSREHVNMVTPHYYERDRTFQDRFDMLERTAQLSVKPTIHYEPSADRCVITFADSSAAGETNGEVRFFRVSDSREDVLRPLALDAAGTQTISTGELSHGSWLVQLSWSRKGVSYYIEERIYVRSR